MNTSHHDVEIKIRLTEADGELVELLARRRDVPKAVFLRQIVVHALREASQVPAVNGRACEGLHRAG